MNNIMLIIAVVYILLGLYEDIVMKNKQRGGEMTIAAHIWIVGSILVDQV